MDERIRDKIARHENFQRLKQIFPLDFVVYTLDNPQRGENPKLIAKLLRENAENPSLFIAGMHYHELVELEEARKAGYDDLRLAQSNANNPAFGVFHTTAKIKEIEMQQETAREVLDMNLPFSSIIFAAFGPGKDYDAPVSPYWALYTRLKELEKAGFTQFSDKFSIDQVQEGLKLFEIGGDKCLGRQIALDYAQMYLSGVVGRRPSILDFL